MPRSVSLRRSLSAASISAAFDRLGRFAVEQLAAADFFQGDFFDGQVARQGFFHQRGSGGIADDRVERGDDDGIARQPAFGLFAVGLDAHARISR